MSFCPQNNKEHGTKPDSNGTVDRFFDFITMVLVSGRLPGVLVFSRNSVRKYLSRLHTNESSSDSDLADKAYYNDLLELDAERLRQITVHFRSIIIVIFQRYSNIAPCTGTCYVRLPLTQSRISYHMPDIKAKGRQTYHQPAPFALTPVSRPAFSLERIDGECVTANAVAPCAGWNAEL